MTRENIKAILDNQLEILADKSRRLAETATASDLAQLTEAMLKTADFLIDLEPIHPRK